MDARDGQRKGRLVTRKQLLPKCQEREVQEVPARPYRLTGLDVPGDLWQFKAVLRFCKNMVVVLRAFIETALEDQAMR